MKVSLARRRVARVLALAAIGLISTALVASSAMAARSPLRSPRAIERLAANAYVWSVAPEFVYRFSRYNYLATAPRNALGGGGTAAAWNNNATNAGDASVLYLNAMIDLSGRKRRGGTKELVLTVPPSRRNYYVVNLLDAFINSVGSIGTRTTPSSRAQTYLLVGPRSRYAHRRVARIHGFTYRVMASDTNLNWMLIRIRADTLVPASDRASAASIQKRVVERFAMTTLRKFEADHHRPQYFEPGTYTPTTQQVNRAQKWHNAPTRATTFFREAGTSLRMNPLPTAKTGLNGIPMRTLPSWVVPQSHAGRLFRNPSYGQARKLARFKPLGLTAKGFRIPSNWGARQLAALQRGYEDGQARINTMQSTVNVSSATNFWSYLNHEIGTYPNTPLGYLYRASVVLAGGAANVPLDAIYAQINNVDGTAATQLDGNSTYKLTFTPPVADPSQLPVVGSLPPMVEDADGDARGFWSIHAYQTDATESAAPFITQASVLNTAYSSASLKVLAVDAAADTITVRPSHWGPLKQSTPILFGSTAAQFGLTPDVPYYVAGVPTSGRGGTVSFQVSTQWKQQLSAGNVPIQGPLGRPGPIADVLDPGGAARLQWGPIQPVSQLGSQQLASGKLAKNPDGSVTIWIGPRLPAGAPATNWLPTPSDAYNAALYPVSVPVLIRPMMRMYYPTPGSDTRASILPPPTLDMGATYVFPAVEKVG